MNKKAQEEILFPILGLIVIIALIGFGATSIPTSYDDCMADCKGIHADNYSYETICRRIDDSPYDCTKVNKTSLNEFCFNECRGASQ